MKQKKIEVKALPQNSLKTEINIDLLFLFEISFTLYNVANKTKTGNKRRIKKTNFPSATQKKGEVAERDNRVAEVFKISFFFFLKMHFVIHNTMPISKVKTVLIRH